MADQMQIVMRQQQEAHEFHLSYDAYDRLEMQWNATLGRDHHDLLCIGSQLRNFKEKEMNLTCNNTWERFNDELNVRDILARTPTQAEQAQQALPPQPPSRPPPPQPRQTVQPPKRRGAKPKFRVGQRVLALHGGTGENRWRPAQVVENQGAKLWMLAAG